MIKHLHGLREVKGHQGCSKTLKNKSLRLPIIWNLLIANIQFSFYEVCVPNQWGHKTMRSYFRIPTLVVQVWLLLFRIEDVIYFSNLIWEDTHMTSTKIVQFSRPPTSLVHLHSIFFHPLDLGHPISNEPILEMITNQLKENVIQGWLFRSFLQVSFRFQYQFINLVLLSFDLSSFRWSHTICFFVPLYSCVCSCPKISLLFIIIHIFSTHFVVNLFYLHNNLETIIKLWNNNRTVHVNERNQNKNKTKSRHIQIDHGLYCSI